MSLLEFMRNVVFASFWNWLGFVIILQILTGGLKRMFVSILEVVIPALKRRKKENV